MSRRLDDEEISRQLVDLPGWRRDGESLRASFEAPTFRAAVEVVVSAADAAEEMDHHPDVDLRYRRLHFALSTHSAGGVTQLDVELAHRISGAARAVGATALEDHDGE